MPCKHPVLALYDKGKILTEGISLFSDVETPLLSFEPWGSQPLKLRVLKALKAHFLRLKGHSWGFKGHFPWRHTVRPAQRWTHRNPNFVRTECYMLMALFERGFWILAKRGWKRRATRGLGRLGKGWRAVGEGLGKGLRRCCLMSL